MFNTSAMDWKTLSADGIVKNVIDFFSSFILFYINILFS